jgi:parallel beta-helix repeat protein
MFAGGTGIIIEGNEIAHNNTDGYDPYWEAGGTKFLRTTDLVVRNNHVHDNHGPGLWTDSNNVRTLYESNIVNGNFGPGIFHEISYSGTIRNNMVENNGFGFTRWLDGAGILVNSSSDVEVYGNTVRNNNDGIAGVQTARGSGDFGPYELRNLWVHDNVVTLNSGNTGVVTNLSDTAVFSSRNNRFDRNTYSTNGIDRPFEWMNGRRTWAEWVAYGLDTGGSAS